MGLAIFVLGAGNKCAVDRCGSERSWSKRTAAIFGDRWGKDVRSRDLREVASDRWVTDVRLADPGSIDLRRSTRNR